MTSTSITAPGLSGLLQMTWLQDDLAHVLEHADVDEPSGTWTNPRMSRSRTDARRRRRQRNAAPPSRKRQDRRPRLGSPRTTCR